MTFKYPYFSLGPTAPSVPENPNGRSLSLSEFCILKLNDVGRPTPGFPTAFSGVLCSASCCSLSYFPLARFSCHWRFLTALVKLGLGCLFTVVSGRGQKACVFNFSPEDYTSLCILYTNQLHVANLSVCGFFSLMCL